MRITAFDVRTRRMALVYQVRGDPNLTQTLTLPLPLLLPLTLTLTLTLTRRMAFVYQG